MTDLMLLRPLWLLALPLIALPFLLSTRGGQLGGWSTAIDPALLEALRRLGRVLPGRAPGRLLPALIAGTLILALSGPALRNGRAPTFRNLDGVIVLLDLSRSITSSGALPEALSAARLVAETASGRPVALILYAGDAYLVSAFTTDTQAIGTTIAAIDAETVADPGSCLACALDLAATILAQSGTIASDIVLISDGTGASEAIVPEGARLSTLFAAPAITISDMPPPAPDALAALAARSGGWSGEAAHPATVINHVASGSNAAALTGDISLLTHDDLGRWLLVPAALLALGLFRRTA